MKKLSHKGAARFKRFRDLQDMSQREFSAVMGVSKSSLKKLEAGKLSKGASSPRFFRRSKEYRRRFY